MKPAEYWRRRSEEVAARQFAKADAYQKELAREYARATEEIRRAIEVFYQRYAINGEVSMAEARRQLSGKELRQFKMTLEEFTEKARNNADGRWTKQLNEVYFRVRVSRYEALLTEIQQQVELLAGGRQKRMRRHLGDVYEDTYYRTVYEIQRGTGFGVTFAKVDQDTLEKVLGTQFAGSNWSNRIWGDRDKLVTELRTKLAQAFIRGESAERTARDLAERMGVSLSNAERLVQTETAFFVGEATAAGYRASGVVDKYEILATLDNRTSEICRSMDGKVFALSEREVGVNYPPLHARCRSTVVPYFDDEIEVGERIARDEDGQTYYVPGDIMYEEWRKRYVERKGLARDDAGMDNKDSGLKFVQQLKPEEIDNAVSKFEAVIRNAEVENVYVIHPDGNVYHAQGSEDWIEFTVEDLELLRDSIVTHNHPTSNGEIGGSFSKADLILLNDYGIRELRVVDELYDYTVRLSERIKNFDEYYAEAYRAAADRALEIFRTTNEMEDYKHLVMLELVKLLPNLKYERRSKR